MGAPGTAPRVVVIPGDGVGPEVVAAACQVLEATGAPVDLAPHQVGTASVLTGGPSVPSATVDAIRTAGVALKGPVATPTDGSFSSPNLALKRELGVSVQVREVRSFPGTTTGPDAVDVLVVRETEEGLYAGRGMSWDDPRADEVRERLAEAGIELPAGSGFSLKFATEATTRRLWSTACEVALAGGRGRVTAVSKAAAIPHTDAAFVSIGREVAGAHGLEFEAVAVDTVAAQLVQRPSRFEVLVATNMYGDIVSDVAGAVAGSVGLVAGRNIAPGATVFEPAHGCAFRHAGRDSVDPIGAILCGASALEHLGFDAEAQGVRGAVARAVADGIRTADLARDTAPVGTAAFAEAVSRRVAAGG